MNSRAMNCGKKSGQLFKCLNASDRLAARTAFSLNSTNCVCMRENPPSPQRSSVWVVIQKLEYAGLCGLGPMQIKVPVPGISGSENGWEDYSGMEFNETGETTT